MSFADTLFSFFPPPDSLRMKHGGVSISDNGIYLINLEPRTGKTHLESYGFFPLEEGVVVAGVIQKPEVVTAILKKISEQFQVQLCSATIPDEKAFIFKTTIKSLAGASLNDLVAVKIQETVPISSGNSLYDYTVVGNRGDEIDVVVRVVHQKVSSVYIGVLKAAGIQPLSLKVESQAIADALLRPSDIAPYILIHIGENRTVFAIAFNKAVYFSTTIDVGTKTFVEHIAQSLKIDAKTARQLITHKDGDSKAAEIAKDKKISAPEKTEGLTESAKIAGEISASLSEITHENIIFATTNVISVLRDEVQKMKEYWQSRDDEREPITKIVVTGSICALTGIEKYMADSFSSPVEIGDMWVNALDTTNIIPSLHHDDALAYVPAIGAALPHKLHW